MGNTNSNTYDQTWAWVGVLGVLALIIGLILLFAVENKAVGGIVIILAVIALLIAFYLWWASQRKLDPINNF